VIDRGRDLPLLKNVIFRIPWKNNNGSACYLGEDWEDRADILLSLRVEHLVNAFESGKILKSLQGRGAQDDISL
jgi:hypothetical protein